jgi:hypothetical protein
MSTTFIELKEVASKTAKLIPQQEVIFSKFASSGIVVSTILICRLYDNSKNYHICKL